MSDAVKRFTVEERADRLQRRQTGPWQTAMRALGPLEVSYRFRRRRRVEAIRLDVAWHDLWVHGLVRGIFIPLVRPMIRRLQRGGRAS